MRERGLRVLASFIIALLLLTVEFPSFYDFLPKISVPKTYANSFSYTEPIIINNTANPSTLTNYQIRVVINTAIRIAKGMMRSDCGDVRFFDSDGTTSLSYWVEPDTVGKPQTVFWVKVPTIPANTMKTIYVSYGNPSLTSASNGQAVFDFFDDFSSYPNGTVLNNTNGWSWKTYNEDTHSTSSDNATAVVLVDPKTGEHYLHMNTIYSSPSGSINFPANKFPADSGVSHALPLGVPLKIQVGLDFLGEDWKRLISQYGNGTFAVSNMIIALSNVTTLSDMQWGAYPYWRLSALSTWGDSWKNSYYYTPSGSTRYPAESTNIPGPNTFFEFLNYSQARGSISFYADYPYSDFNNPFYTPSGAVSMRLEVGHTSSIGKDYVRGYYEINGRPYVWLHDDSHAWLKNVNMFSNFWLWSENGVNFYRIKYVFVGKSSYYEPQVISPNNDASVVGKTSPIIPLKSKNKINATDFAFSSAGNPGLPPPSGLILPNSSIFGFIQYNTVYENDIRYAVMNFTIPNFNGFKVYNLTFFITTTDNSSNWMEVFANSSVIDGDGTVYNLLIPYNLEWKRVSYTFPVLSQNFSIELMFVGNYVNASIFVRNITLDELPAKAIHFTRENMTVSLEGLGTVAFLNDNVVQIQTSATPSVAWGGSYLLDSPFVYGLSFLGRVNTTGATPQYSLNKPTAIIERGPIATATGMLTNRFDLSSSLMLPTSLSPPGPPDNPIPTAWTIYDITLYIPLPPNISVTWSFGETVFSAPSSYGGLIYDFANKTVVNTVGFDDSFDTDPLATHRWDVWVTPINMSFFWYHWYSEAHLSYDPFAHKVFVSSVHGSFNNIVGFVDVTLMRNFPIALTYPFMKYLSISAIIGQNSTNLAEDSVDVGVVYNASGTVILSTFTLFVTGPAYYPLVGYSDPWSDSLGGTTAESWYAIDQWSDDLSHKDPLPNEWTSKEIPVKIKFFGNNVSAEAPIGNVILNDSATAQKSYIVGYPTSSDPSNTRFSGFDMNTLPFDYSGLAIRGVAWHFRTNCQDYGSSSPTANATIAPPGAYIKQMTVRAGFIVIKHAPIGAPITLVIGGKAIETKTASDNGTLVFFFDPDLLPADIQAVIGVSSLSPSLPAKTLFVTHNITYVIPFSNFSNVFSSTSQFAGYSPTDAYGWRVYALPTASSSTTAKLSSTITFKLPYTGMLIRNVTLYAKTNYSTATNTITISALGNTLIQPSIPTTLSKVVFTLDRVNPTDTLELMINTTVGSSLTEGSEVNVENVTVFAEYTANPPVFVHVVAPGADFNCTATFFANITELPLISSSKIYIKLIKYLTFIRTDYPQTATFAFNQTMLNDTYVVHSISPALTSKNMTIVMSLPNVLKNITTLVNNEPSDYVLLGNNLTVLVERLANFTVYTPSLNITFNNAKNITIPSSALPEGYCLVVANVSMFFNYTVGYNRKLLPVASMIFSLKLLGIHSERITLYPLNLEVFNQSQMLVFSSIGYSSTFTLTNLKRELHQIKVRIQSFFVGNTNLNITESLVGQTVVMKINASQFTDYNGKTRLVVVNNTKLLDVKSAGFSFGKTLIYVEGTGTTRISIFYSIKPTSVSVLGNVTDLNAVWNGSQLLITVNLGSVGAINVTDLYQLAVNVKDTKNNVINFVTPLANGTAVATPKLLPASYYVVSLPSTSKGFKFAKFVGGATSPSTTIALTQDQELTAVYKIPVNIKAQVVKPTVLASDQNNSVRIVGNLTDYYGAVVPNKQVTILVQSAQGTQTFSETTDASGVFSTPTINLAQGTKYTITVSTPEDDYYVENSTQITYETAGGSLIPPIQEFSWWWLIALLILLLLAIAIIYVARKSAKHVIEEESEKRMRFVKRKLLHDVGFSERASFVVEKRNVSNKRRFVRRKEGEL